MQDIFGCVRFKYIGSPTKFLGEVKLAETTVKGRRFTVVLEKDEDDGGYSVQCLELPGAISEGETREEALRNIKEAIELVLEVLEEKARSRKPGAEIAEVVV